MLASSHFIPLSSVGVELGLEGSHEDNSLRIVDGLMVSSQNCASPKVDKAEANCVLSKAAGSAVEGTIVLPIEAAIVKGRDYRRCVCVCCFYKGPLSMAKQGGNSNARFQVCAPVVALQLSCKSLDRIKKGVLLCRLEEIREDNPVAEAYSPRSMIAGLVVCGKCTSATTPVVGVGHELVSHTRNKEFQ